MPAGGHDRGEAAHGMTHDQGVCGAGVIQHGHQVIGVRGHPVRAACRAALSVKLV
jgi:hypothetical protein